MQCDSCETLTTTSLKENLTSTVTAQFGHIAGLEMAGLFLACSRYLKSSVLLNNTHIPLPSSVTEASAAIARSGCSMGR